MNQINSRTGILKRYFGSIGSIDFPPCLRQGVSLPSELKLHNLSRGVGCVCSTSCHAIEEALGWRKKPQAVKRNPERDRDGSGQSPIAAGAGHRVHRTALAAPARDDRCSPLTCSTTAHRSAGINAQSYRGMRSFPREIASKSSGPRVARPRPSPATARACPACSPPSRSLPIRRLRDRRRRRPGTDAVPRPAASVPPAAGGRNDRHPMQVRPALPARGLIRT